MDGFAFRTVLRNESNAPEKINGGKKVHCLPDGTQALAVL